MLTSSIKAVVIRPAVANLSHQEVLRHDSLLVSGVDARRAAECLAAESSTGRESRLAAGLVLVIGQRGRRGSSSQMQEFDDERVK